MNNLKIKKVNIKKKAFNFFFYISLIYQWYIRHIRWYIWYIHRYIWYIHRYIWYIRWYIRYIANIFMIFWQAPPLLYALLHARFFCRFYRFFSQYSFRSIIDVEFVLKSLDVWYIVDKIRFFNPCSHMR